MHIHINVVNLSLFVQMLQFIVAYWILTVFFLKPAYKLVMQEKHKKSALLKEVHTIQGTYLHELKLTKHDLTLEQERLQQELHEPVYYAQELPVERVQRHEQYQATEVLIQDLIQQAKKRI